MKKILFIITLLSLFSCEKEKTFTDSIYEKWYIESANPLGILLNEPSNGSYIQLNYCEDSTCIGLDYRSTDKTSGRFEYKLDIDENILTINDSTLNGGSWNGIWRIEKISRSEMFISQYHRFGDLSYKLIKK